MVRSLLCFETSDLESSSQSWLTSVVSGIWALVLCTPLPPLLYQPARIGMVKYGEITPVATLGGRGHAEDQCVYSGSGFALQFFCFSHLLRFARIKYEDSIGLCRV